MTHKLDFEFDVRIPAALVQQMMDGEITCAMLTTMTILHKWANWSTGLVRFCSARGLVTASHKAYSERTFQVSLQKLEAMGWITRHMVPGSHKDYAVTINNYKVTDDEGKVQIINPKKIKVCDPTKVGSCAEASDEGSDETSEEGSDEGSDKVLLNNKPDLLPETKPDFLPDNDGLSVSQSFNRGTGVPLTEEQERDRSKSEEKSQTPSESVSEEEKQRQEQIEALAREIGCRTDIPHALGIPYFHAEHDLKRIAAVLYHRNRSEHWLAQLVHWAKGITDPKDREGNFWKRKLQTGDRAVAKLAEYLETGTIAEQFDSRLHARHPNCLLVEPGKRNDLLLRDGVWFEAYRQTDERKALAARVASAVRGFEYEPPEDDDLAPVGRGFDDEDPEPCACGDKRGEGHEGFCVAEA